MNYRYVGTVGEILTFKDVPGLPPGYQWRIAEITPTGDLRLTPVNDPFNAATGVYWMRRSGSPKASRYPRIG